MKAGNPVACPHGRGIRRNCSRVWPAANLGLSKVIVMATGMGIFMSERSTAKSGDNERAATTKASAISRAGDRRDGLDAVFEPRSIAVVGASELPGSLGRTVFKNLVDAGFTGRLDAVNLKAGVVFGRPSVGSLKDLPEPPDLVVIAVPARAVEPIIDDCAAVGAGAAIILSAGFEQLGADAKGIQRRILQKARDAGMRLVGPNCLGIIRPSSHLNASFAATAARPGRIAFLSQSGALCTAVLDWSVKENVGFSAFASVGSMLDVNWADLIDYFGNDPETTCLLVYLESVGDARSFLAAARRTALSKPIVVLKGGRTEAASRAALSHTGALAGSDRVFDAAMKRVGVLRVDELAELFYVAEVLSKQPLPGGRRLTIVTNAGGPGILATDALVRGGGELAPLSDRLVEQLDGVLPSFWSGQNPIDIIGDATPARFTQAVEIAVENPDSDALLVILTPQSMTEPAETARQLLPVLRRSVKPVLTSWMGGPGVEEANALFNSAGLPTLAFPEMAARVHNHLWKYRQEISNLYQTPAGVGDLNGLDARQAIVAVIFDDALRAQRTLLSEDESKRVLAAYGISTVPTVLAATADEAVTQAHLLGFPVVLKLHSLTHTHKSDIGGVKLGLMAEDDVRRAFEEVRESLHTHAGLSEFPGVSVQPMEQGQGVDLILGSSYDSQFGPCILFGSGGTFVEITGDQAVGIPPLNSTLARRLIEQTRIAAALKGFRGRPPVDLNALDRVLVAFSDLVLEQPRIRECDINPLFAAPDGIRALDARIVLHPPRMTARELTPPAIRPYPLEYVRTTSIGDGTQIRLRPIRLEDEPAMARFHAALSEDSIRQRYFGLTSLSHRTDHARLLRVCLNDFDCELAIVAELVGAGEILGVGRLSRVRQSSTAEISLIVADQWQHQGLGRRLLEQLKEIGRREGVERLTATMLTGNTGMFELCRQCGFRPCQSPIDHVIHVQCYLQPLRPTREDDVLL